VTLGVGAVLLAFSRERHLGVAVLVANAGSHLAVQLLKRAVHRPRPCDANGVPLALVDLPDPYSFPSGHAAAATAVATSISLAHPALAPALLPLAILISRSRVTLRVHHPGDVIAGAVLGASGAIAAATLL